MTGVQSARSFLFVPGDRPERFDKAIASGADVVIIDLEDAVAPEAKASARDATVAWLAGGGRAAVRVNAADSPEHEDDVAALAGIATAATDSGLVAIVLPKADDPDLASSVANQTGVPVIALVESALGLVRAHEIASATGVSRLAFGHLDYAVDLGSGNGREPMLHARSTLVLTSRAAGLPGPIDGVTTALDETEVLTDDLAYARDLGLTGKLLIHPKQVEPTHAAHRPSEEDVAWAQRVIEAAASGGAVRVDGDMVDAPVVARAEDVLRRRES
ncbi:HpcH/HpaI aldolase/citrate lyase family protein [Ornithinimicrobium cryptoxanthini]|uniref:CoA ester lyase n=1 Tax=Ornithinimicrobium cryptoxanthini TaxID=2934161 RepID=A0ABY4YH43_9MICO|nr:CoA ester lyase [Ornithinimicrobium cryptoxanthini]USQ76058.1 CoA ester lyase [Ornithinimicrobium cryptoxanthini]